MMMGKRLVVALLPLALAACATTGTASKDKALPAGKIVAAAHAPVLAPKPTTSPYAPATEDLSTRGNYVAGGLYLPGVPDTVPDDIPDVDAIPEPEVRDEPRSRGGNRDYSVLGKRYQVMDEHNGYVETGQASYYGKKFHGRRTSNQEVYDMYAFTAAHKTLPLPSYARVTNLDNGKSIVVRVNDRGPFHQGRVIDLSYAAAVKLGYRDRGTARVEVRALTPDDGDTTLAVRKPAADATAMDQLVGRLPEASVDAGAVAGFPVNSAKIQRGNPQNRFETRQREQAIRAEKFDAQMRSRGERVATAKPGIPDSVIVAMPRSLPAATVAISQPVAFAPSSSITTAALAAATTSTPAAAGLGDNVVFQIASFSNDQNAQHALALLQGAAISNARLMNADVDGKKIWRLRIGPIAAATAPELAARVVGLGFGQPQRVRD